MKNLRDSYKHYKATAEQNKVDIKVYLSIVHLFMKFLISKVLDGYRVALPQNLGSLMIVGKKQNVRFDEDGKPKGLAPDWVKTKKLWDQNEEAKKEKKLVYHLNEHSDGIRYRYHWRKRGVFFKNGGLYSLRMTRENKRTLSKQIKQGGEFLTFD